MRQRPARPRRAQGRPGLHLHADDPRAAYAMLACARIGAVHSVVFAGFSAGVAARPHPRRRLQGRDHRQRGPARRQAHPAQADSATTPSTASRASTRCSWPAAPTRERADDAPAATSGSTRRWPAQRSTCPVEWMDSEDPLFILYTSGSTGKPKGVLHTTGGYLVLRRPRRYQLRLRLPARTTFTSAPPTSAGSPATATSSTGRSPTAPPRCCSRVVPTYPDPGALLEDRRRARRHHASTPRRRRSGPSPAPATSGSPRPRASTLRLLGHGRRAHQPRGLELVPRRRRRRPLRRSSTPGGRPRPAAS